LKIFVGGYLFTVAGKQGNILIKVHENRRRLKFIWPKRMDT
jgi:hypothetical protein